MLNVRTLLCATALSIAAIGASSAETTPLTLTGLAKFNNIKAAQAAPMVPFTVHAGAMVTPRGALLAGGDIDLPSVTLGKGFTGRLDVDAIFKANFGGVNTLTLVTIDQISSTTDGISGHNVYYGGGLGAVFGGGTKFDGKLILGTELTKRFSAEVNVHFSSSKTLVCLLTRIHI
ncbi:MAG: hypothetical protein ABJA67_09075 [Chthonomonadales bacterium]